MVGTPLPTTMHLDADLETRSATLNIARGDRSVVRFDHAMHDRQSQTSSGVLRREERVEDAVEHASRNSRAAIDNRQAALPRIILRDCRSVCDIHLARTVDRLDRVEHEIHQRLAK